MWFQGDDVLHFSLKALREIFKNCDPTELPTDLAECLAGNADAIKANNIAGKAWEQQLATLRSTTPNPNSTSYCQPPTSTKPKASGMSPTPQCTQQTAHRTGDAAAPDNCTQPDLPHFHTPANSEQGRTNWEPHIVYPELGVIRPPIEATEPPNEQAEPPIEVTDPPTDMTALNAERVQNDPKPTEPDTQQPPSRTARIKLNRSRTGQMDLIDIDVRDFLDVPLRYAEGRDLLAAIGASAIPIPTDLIAADPGPSTADLGPIATRFDPTSSHSGLQQSKRPTRAAKGKSKKDKKGQPLCSGPSKPAPRAVRVTRSNSCTNSSLPSFLSLLTQTHAPQPAYDLPREDPLPAESLPGIPLPDQQHTSPLTHPPHVNLGADNEDDLHLNRIVYSDEECHAA